MAGTQSSTQSFVENPKSLKIYHTRNQNSAENPENKNRYSILLY